MYATTGLTDTEFDEVVIAVLTTHPELNIKPRNRGSHIGVSFRRRVHIAVAYARTNITEQALAEFFATSQPTVSAIITAFTAAVSDALAPVVPTGDDLDPREQLIIDGTLCPCWSWRDQEHLWSGKHHRTGVNLQVALDHHGCLRWVCDPLPGATHDAAALRASSILETVAQDADFASIGDKGYIGLGMLTPTKKPPGGDLTEEQKKNNRVICSVRVVVERAIANLKTYRVLHTDYRRPFSTFTTTISMVVGLAFFRSSGSPY